MRASKPPRRRPRDRPPDGPAAAEPHAPPVPATLTPDGVLALQRTAGNQRVQTALAARGRAGGPLLQRTPEEAASIETMGRKWYGYVYRNRNQQERAQFEQQIKDEIAQAGVTVRGPPFLMGEPLVYMGGKAYKYTDIAAWAAGQPNAAQQLLDWKTGNVELQTLDGRLQALAWITHFAEVARGFLDAPGGLQALLQAIVAGNATWNDVLTYIPAAATYAQDTRGPEWTPNQ
jgi:hypothetical protein